jgi:hypothetical protein
MKIDIGEQRRDNSSLWYALLCFCKELTFHHSGLKELPDQVNYILVSNTSFDKA